MDILLYFDACSNCVQEMRVAYRCRLTIQNGDLTNPVIVSETAVRSSIKDCCITHFQRILQVEESDQSKFSCKRVSSVTWVLLDFMNLEEQERKISEKEAYWYQSVLACYATKIHRRIDICQLNQNDKRTYFLVTVILKFSFFMLSVPNVFKWKISQWVLSTICACNCGLPLCVIFSFAVWHRLVTAQFKSQIKNVSFPPLYTYSCKRDWSQ